MAIEESYEIEKLDFTTGYYFRSFGEKGEIIKVVLYQKKGKNRFNLAFGDLVKGNINDKVISNNHDLKKVISTVVKTLYEFTEENPKSIIIIKGVDEKRTKFYNTVFKRRLKEIKETFYVIGIQNGVKENYLSNKFYEIFEIQRKMG